MRPAGKGPLESLYFKYPHFEAPPNPVSPERVRVVIVGGGPIGMTAALTLARYGVASIVVEQKTTFNDGSRAICIARPSMHILERIGAVAPFLGKALGWQYGRSTYRGQEIYRLEMPHSADEKYLPMYNLQQQYIEQYLFDAMAREPLIDMRWQSSVVAIDQTSAAVAVHVETPEGSYRIESDYVLAADGARSAVRSKLGLRLKGDNYEGRYVIADVKMAHDFPTERRAFFGMRAVPGGTVLIHKQPDDIWRIDYQLKDTEANAQATQEDHVRTRVAAILDEIGETGPWELEWWSVYTANTLALDAYKHGRVLFIGDSAHIVPIFGVRGLNNGLADAHNAGWKLAYVLNEVAQPTLLESYSIERRGATLDVFANATKATRFMTPPTRGWAVVREAALSLSVQHAFARGFANPRQMQPYVYADSPLTPFGEHDSDFAPGAGGKPVSDAPASRAPMSGSMLRNVLLLDGRHLTDCFGDGYTVMLFVDGAVTADAQTALDRLAAFDPQMTLLIVSKIAAEGVLDDPDHRIWEAYGAADGTLYLIRPDLHVAARWRLVNWIELETALACCVGRAAPNGTAMELIN